jgi:3-deoxy-manno-octulosonate cytidylyltransferase (CMP-KDO synthetase)
VKSIGIIPARMESTRFPGKPMKKILGKIMIRWVYESCLKSNLDYVVVATDSEEIEKAVLEFGGNVCMTPEFENGTLRVLYASEIFNDFNVIVNIQGDEPSITSENINDLLESFEKNKISTLHTTLPSYELDDSNVVKIYTQDSDVLTFSRSVEESYKGDLYKHIGAYMFPRNILIGTKNMRPSLRENSLKLEQMKWMDNGIQMKSVRINNETIGVDTPEDINKVEKLLQ